MVIPGVIIIESAGDMEKKNILSQIDPEVMFFPAPKHSHQLLDKHGNKPNKLAYPAGWRNCQDHVNTAS